MSWTTLAKSVQTWTATSASSVSWNPSTHSLAASVASRFNRVYPQAESTLTDVNFVYRVQTFGLWFVATGNGVVVQSTITAGV